MTKICTKCREEFPATLDFFSSRKRNKDGLHEMCKSCRTARDKQYRQEHKERYAETTKTWKEANKEHIDMLNAAYAKAHKERKSEINKAWYEKNKERKSEMVKLWAAQNKERRNNTIKAWRENHKENYDAIIKRYRESHPDSRAMWAERRRTLKNNLPSTLTKEQWEQTKAAFNNKCAYCGSGGKLTQEHIVPVSDGGGYTAENIIPACARCNFSKKQKPFELWYPSQAFYSVEREAAILRVVGGYAVQSSEST